MRAFLATLVLAISALVGLSSPAAADYCGASGNGCAQSGAEAGSCAGHGSFGAFGENGDIRHDFAGGADGTQTGINNSNLCGNPQGVTTQ